jgi:hypothetical protein
VAKLIAFHGDPTVKERYLSRLKKHAAAGEIRQGVYWSNGVGCAVGCTVHSRNHYDYEKELGIPAILAFLEEQIFEMLPSEVRQWFPVNFLNAITPGVDLSPVLPRFLVWLLINPEYGVVRFAHGAKMRDAIIAVSTLFARLAAGYVPAYPEWQAARVAAYDTYVTAAANSAAYAAAAATVTVANVDVDIIAGYTTAYAVDAIVAYTVVDAISYAVDAVTKAADAVQYSLEVIMANKLIELNSQVKE